MDLVGWVNMENECLATKYIFVMRTDGGFSYEEGEVLS